MASWTSWVPAALRAVVTVRPLLTASAVGVTAGTFFLTHKRSEPMSSTVAILYSRLKRRHFLAIVVLVVLAVPKLRVAGVAGINRCFRLLSNIVGLASGRLQVERVRTPNISKLHVYQSRCSLL
eukprot:SAG31_NODE_2076_length_6507_cov_3.611267_2_plen_124_part_00